MTSRRSECDFWYADCCPTVCGKAFTEQNMIVKPTPVLVDVSVSSRVASDWLSGFHMC